MTNKLREAIEEARAEFASGDSMAYRGVCAHPPRRHRKLLPYRVYL